MSAKGNPQETKPVETSPSDAPESSVDRFEHQIEELEGLDRKKQWWVWVLGFVVIVGLIGAYYYFQGQAKPVEAVRALAGTTPLDLVQPIPGKLSAKPSVFRWESVTGRSNYMFKLIQREPPLTLAMRMVKDTETTLTPEEAAKLEKGRKYTWQVEALDARGARIAGGASTFEF